MSEGPTAVRPRHWPWRHNRKSKHSLHRLDQEPWPHTVLLSLFNSSIVCTSCQNHTCGDFPPKCGRQQPAGTLMVKRWGQRPLLWCCNSPNTDDMTAVNNDYPSIECIPAAKLGLVLTQTGQRHFLVNVLMPSLGDRERNNIKH